MENRFFSVGGTVSPLSSSVGGSSILKDADPVLSTFLDFFPAVIRTHAQTRWNDEVIACGRSDLSGSMVAQVLPYDPLPLAAENAWQFPLLAIYPTESEYLQRSVTWFEIKRSFQLLYILPPLAAEQLEVIYPFLSHVERTLQDRIMEGEDQDYNGGQLVWRDCGLEQIRTVRGTFGKVPNSNSNLNMHCFSMDLEVTERRNPASFLGNFVAYEGMVSGSIDIASGSSDIGQTSGSFDGPFTDFIVDKQLF